ncbi:MAG: hypothetical protein ACM31L_08475 [Actinomycetota bacterium]
MHMDFQTMQAVGAVIAVLAAWIYRFELIGLVVAVAAYLLGRLLGKAVRLLAWGIKAAWRRHGGGHDRVRQA